MKMSDEDTALRLLRAAVPRTAVSDARSARVKAQLRARWERNLRRCAMRRRIAASILGLAAAATLGVLTRSDRRVVPLGAPIAIVEHVVGTPQLVASAADNSSAALLSPNDPIREGACVKTDALTRVAFRLSTGASLRLDAGSLVCAQSSTLIALSSGAVYVDTEGESARLEVRTPLGTARDIGTQFEIRLFDHEVRLRVRTGIVELTDRKQSVSAKAGTEITLSGTGAVSCPIAVHGSDWEWMARLSPSVEMNGASLAVFLERLAREHGWTVRYDEPALGRQAAAVILHGSTADLSPRDRVEAAIATSGLQHRFEGGDLVVFR